MRNELLTDSEYIDELLKENAFLKDKCNKLSNEIKKQRLYALRKRMDAHSFEKRIMKMESSRIIIAVDPSGKDTQHKMVQKLQMLK